MNSHALESTLESAMKAQTEGIRHLLELARQAGFQNIPPKKICIITNILDGRVKSDESLPYIGNVWFELR
jgi:hypothetical protein